jgi:hypothetical protein
MSDLDVQQTSLCSFAKIIFITKEAKIGNYHHRFHIMSLNIPKFEKVQNFVTKFQKL